MKKVSVVMMAAAIAAGMAVTSCNQQGGAANVALSAPIDSASYALGINIGSNLKENLKTFPGEKPVNHEAFMSGLMAAMKDSAAMKMTPEVASS